ncbi:hypothetical protein SLS62_007369 [Diatrype stigma]|uniref:Phytase-like domain-containing protein n=1 Tax=Diatrype stigma TaxID=117547 RepID=A0AAN9ULD5_9PEZI
MGLILACFRLCLTVVAPGATAEDPAGPNLVLNYQDTIRFSGPDGQACTGLDADATGFLSYPGFPDLPVATFTGDGFGGDGPGGKRIPVDSEGLYVNKDGTFWVSEEYGPYVYLFDSEGKMLTAIRPPDAIIPMRNGTESFSADSPPRYIDDGDGPGPIPADPDSGRDNNSGFEGMHVSDDGRTLWVMLQSAAVQEGGLKGKYRKYTRLLKYDISAPLSPAYAAEYVVPLPLYPDPDEDPDDNLRVAKQSEIHSLPNGQFLVLARDSGGGHGQARSQSVYRHIDVFDVSAATDASAASAVDHDCATCAIATTKAKLDADVAPARYCAWLDFNVDAQLARFGLHNGGAQDASLLNEKWESIALAPVDPTGDGEEGEEFFLFSLSDNDFITQNGFMDGGKLPYADSSGYNLDSQALVFKVKIPK